MNRAHESKAALERTVSQLEKDCKLRNEARKRFLQARQQAKKRNREEENSNDDVMVANEDQQVSHGKRRLLPII